MLITQVFFRPEPNLSLNLTPRLHFPINENSQATWKKETRQLAHGQHGLEVSCLLDAEPSASGNFSLSWI